MTEDKYVFKRGRAVSIRKLIDYLKGVLVLQYYFKINHTWSL
jgi:hypothetical protein